MAWIGVLGTTEVVPCYKALQLRHFPQYRELSESGKVLIFLMKINAAIAISVYTFSENALGFFRSLFYPIRPDFVVELLSPSDSRSDAEAKMRRWMANGVLLGWLIDPFEETVLLYKAGKRRKALAGKMLHAEAPVEAFTLDLDRLRRDYAA